MLLSVVIPIYKAEKTITRLVDTLHVELKNYDFEIIMVNDASPDNSAEVCKALVKRYENTSLISLRKNFGEFNAVMCGLNHVKGKYAVMIDDDFQNPPSEIIKLVEEAERGDYDVVYGQYREKKHSLFRNFGSWLVNYITTPLLGKPRDLYLASFKLIRKEVVDEICKYTGPFPYIDGLVFSVTTHIGRVYVQHDEREHGESNYTFKKLLTVFFNILFGYSLLPVRFVLFSGLALILISFVMMGLHISDIFDTNSATLITFFAGFRILCIGIIGEYIGKAFLTQSSSPQFTVKYRVYNHDKE